MAVYLDSGPAGKPGPIRRGDRRPSARPPSVGVSARPPSVGVSVPALYRCSVMHRRNTTAKRSFTYSSYYWLIDVDQPVRVPAVLRPFARFRPADHLGDPMGTLASNIRALLAVNGIEADRILLLTCPRIAGYVFNPLSVYYCFSGEEQIAVVAEVHNTYGGRHVYVLRPDAAGRDQVEKRFYVSPFLPIGGKYLMRTPPPGERLHVSIALRIGEQTPFVATLTGRGGPADIPAQLGALLRWPLVTLRTAALIRWQGIRLWLRGIPVHRRPADATGSETAR